MQRLQTEELPVIQTESFELQHSVSQLQRLRLKMLLVYSVHRKKKECLKKVTCFKKNKANPAQYRLNCNNTDTPLVQSHLSICLCVSGPHGGG